MPNSINLLININQLKKVYSNNHNQRNIFINNIILVIYLLKNISKHNNQIFKVNEISLLINIIRIFINKY